MRGAEGSARLMIRIGLISDTHGLLRPEAKAFLSGSDVIIHAGDIGGPDILAELNTIAPVRAVRGNNDSGAWAEALNDTELLRLGGVDITRPRATRHRAVLVGHPGGGVGTLAQARSRGTRRCPVRESGQRRSPALQIAHRHR
jgi:hypothetical protein